MGVYLEELWYLEEQLLEGGERDKQNGYPVYTHHMVASWHTGPLPRWWVEAIRLLSMTAGSSLLLLCLSYH